MNSMNRLLLVLAVVFPADDILAQCAAGNVNVSLRVETPSTAFSDHVDGTVTHELTGLMWKRCSQGQSWNGAACTGSALPMTWVAALMTPLSDVTGGYTDWRLPNEQELHSILETCGAEPAINQTIFPNTPYASPFWSSTSWYVTNDSAWHLSFEAGQVAVGPKSGSNHARLVRGGQGFTAMDVAPTEGDLNGDGVIDSLDVGVLVSLWGGSEWWADLDRGGKVDAPDLELLLAKM